MTESRPFSGFVHAIPHSYAESNLGIPNFLPMQSRHFGPNATNHENLITAIVVSDTIIRRIELAIRDLLWSPDRFLAHLLLSVWTSLVTAPPLVRLGLVYLIFRYVVYRWAVWAVKDYQDYLDLGRGGSPSNIWGWWRVKRLEFMAAINVFDPPHVPPMLDPYRGILWDVPQRQGTRPTVKGIAPQRQTNQKTPVKTFDVLLNVLAAYAQTHPTHLKLDKSYLEGHTAALKANRHAWPGIPGTEGEYGFEICHPHRQDGSLHMIMHPEDIRTIIEAGWGERHPLATNVWYWRWWYHTFRQRRKPVPEYLVFIYAPRDAKELEIVYRMIRAAIWFATKRILDAKRLEDDEEDRDDDNEEEEERVNNVSKTLTL